MVIKHASYAVLDGLRGSVGKQGARLVLQAGFNRHTGRHLAHYVLLECIPLLVANPVKRAPMASFKTKSDNRTVINSVHYLIEINRLEHKPLHTTLKSLKQAISWVQKV